MTAKLELSETNMLLSIPLYYPRMAVGGQGSKILGHFFFLIQPHLFAYYFYFIGLLKEMGIFKIVNSSI